MLLFVDVQLIIQIYT